MSKFIESYSGKRMITDENFKFIMYLNIPQQYKINVWTLFVLYHLGLKSLMKHLVHTYFKYREPPKAVYHDSDA